MKNKITNIIFGLAFMFVFLFLAVAPASAAINSQINFQGKITNPDGTNIANGTKSITFNLYTVASAGTTLWTETDAVVVTDGVFQVNLGSCPFLTANTCNNNTPVDFNNSSLYLGITVSPDTEMTPRVSFTASPYAFNSDKLGGLDKTGFIQNNTTQQATSNFNISGTGIAAVLQAGTFDTSAAGALNIGTTLATSLIIAKAAVPTTVAGSLSVTQATTLNALLTVNNDLQFGQGANRNVSVNANTTANAAGYNLTLAAGAANGSTTGATGGTLALQGGAAAGSGNNNGGTISLDGGAPTAAGTRGSVAIQGTGGATSVGGTLGVSGLITANGGLTLAANQNLTLTTGTGVISQGYSNATTGNAINQTITNSNASATAATVSASNVTLVGATNANAAANTLVGYNLGTVTPVTNNAFYGLNVGTGFTDILRYSNTQLISGLGKLQNAAFDTTGLYTNLTGVGALTSGSIASGFGTIATGNTITTASTLQGATVNATTGFTLSGTSINTAGTLTNVAYLNQANTFSAAGSALTVTNNASVGGTLTVTGLLTVSGGQTTTGAVSINTTGTANTAIGNATGTFNVTSSALNITSVGAISGVTTLSAASTITGTVLNATIGLNTGAAAGTQRIDASGNVVNVGNITTTGASTLTTGGANGLTIKPTTDNAAAFQLQTAGGVSFLAFSSSTATLNVGPTTANAGTLNVATGAAVQAVTIGSTNTTSSTAIQGGTTGSIGIGSTGTSTLSSATNIANTSNVTGTQVVNIGSNANAANSILIDAGTSATGIQIGNSSTAHTIAIGAGGAAGGTVQNVVIGSNSTTASSLVTLQGGIVTTVNNQAGIIIGGGFSTVDTNLTVLTLDSTSTLTETANTCSATANNGALYYNSNAGSNAVRACVGGSWEDLVSTAGAFSTFFGVVPDSGATPGDIQSLATASTTGPCKVSWASTTTVNVTGCIAYSNGRKVTVAATTVTLSAFALNNFYHICLNGTNNQVPTTNSTGSTVESANLGTFSLVSASNPIVCLADVKSNATAITAVYDTRVFTNTTKEFGYAGTAALALGVMVKPDATNFNRLALPGVAATGYMRGVVVASNGAVWAAGQGPNVIIATGGTVGVKSSAAITLAASTSLQNSTVTSGYAIAATGVATVYGNIGIPQLPTTVTSASTTACATAAGCVGGTLTTLNIK